MRVRNDSALARVVAVLGAAQQYHAHVLANKRTNRLRLLVQDSIGIYCLSTHMASAVSTLLPHF